MTRCTWGPPRPDGSRKCVRCRNVCPAGMDAIGACQPNPLPLGDHTERLLSRLGVTKDRYAAAKAAVGLAPTCHCEKVQEWLNRVGAWLAGRGPGA